MSNMSSPSVGLAEHGRPSVAAAAQGRQNAEHHHPHPIGCHNSLSCSHLHLAQSSASQTPFTSQILSIASASSPANHNSCYCAQHYPLYQEHSTASSSSSPHYHYPHLPLLPSAPNPMPIGGPSATSHLTTRSTTLVDDNDAMQISGETHVAVTVHHQQPAAAALHHQYQILDHHHQHEENEMNSCDCKHDDHQSGCNSSRLASADESNASRSGPNDGGGTWQGSSRYNQRRTSNKNRLAADPTKIRNGSGGRPKRSTVNDRNSSHIEVYSDEAELGGKTVDSEISGKDQGPPLPPRPSPKDRPKAPHSSGVKKYIVWCLICGGFACLLGAMFLGVYFLLRSYTSTIGYFETVPTFVPAALLVITGLSIMSLARRRNRYSYLIKLSGILGLVSALTCALATVTTTVLHMSRLQSLKECEYTPKTRTCTCYSEIIGPQMERFDEEGVKLVVDSTNDCGVVHGSIYSCLRAIFGLSVAGVIISVFCCLLVYQLLSHERKKKYWEQLDLRCRSLYASQQAQLAHTRPQSAAMMNGQPAGSGCSCCEQCHAHRHAHMQPTYPWETSGVDNRFWDSAGHPPGNFYSPNPGGDSLTNSRQNGWRWPRMPWKRHSPPTSDSQYGFFPGSETVEQIPNDVGPSDNPVQPPNGFNVVGATPYSVWGPPPPYSDPNSPARRGVGGGHCGHGHFHPNSNCRGNGSHPLQHQHAAMSCPQHNSGRQVTDVASHLEPNISKEAERGFKTRNNYENTHSDSDSSKGHFMKTTTPNRKLKKRGAENCMDMASPLKTASSAMQVGEMPAAVAKSVKHGLENSGYQNGDMEVEPTESEIYFADGSSCCNNSLRNDNYYEQARSLSNAPTGSTAAQDDNDDYLAKRFGERENSIRSRYPVPQLRATLAEKSQLCLPIPKPREAPIPKNISRQSMCSVDSGERTDFTDLSPATPCGVTTFPPKAHISMKDSYHSADRTTVLRSNPDACLAPDAQYETVDESDQT